MRRSTKSKTYWVILSSCPITARTANNINETKNKIAYTFNTIALPPRPLNLIVTQFTIFSHLFQHKSNKKWEATFAASLEVVTN